MKKMILFSVIALMFAACGSGGEEDEGPNGPEGGCEETLPGCETNICANNYERSCSEDKLHYEYNLCYQQMCSNGVCVPAGCLEPDKRTCVSNSEYELCLPNMSFTTNKDCSEGQICKEGACVDEACTNGNVECGWKAVLTCDDGQNWKAEACGEKQYCDPKTGSCRDMEPFCVDNQLGATCGDLDTSLICLPNGSFQEEKCGSKEVCAEGFCQPRACTVEYTAPVTGEDVVEQPKDIVIKDTTDPRIEETVTIDLPPKDIPPLEKKPKAWVTIDGGEFNMEKVEFKSTKEANYVFKDKDLQVSMAKGQLLLEIHFQGIEEGVVGSFSSAEPGSVTVGILFNDGTTDQEIVQWKYVSGSYSATLDQFDPPGGRAIGTFSGVLDQHPNAGEGPPLTLTDGEFDVPRKE